MLTDELARLLKAPPKAWIGALTVQMMVDWLVHELTRLHPENQEITVETASFQTS